MPAVVGPATSRRTPASTAAIGGPTNVVRNNGFRIVRFTLFMAVMACSVRTLSNPGTTEFEYARKTPDTAAVSTSDTTATIDARTDTATSVDRVAGIVPDRVVPAQTLSPRTVRSGGSVLRRPVEQAHLADRLHVLAHRRRGGLRVARADGVGDSAVLGERARRAVGLAQRLVAALGDLLGDGAHELGEQAAVGGGGHRGVEAPVALRAGLATLDLGRHVVECRVDGGEVVVGPARGGEFRELGLQRLAGLEHVGQPAPPGDQLLHP